MTEKHVGGILLLAVIGGIGFGFWQGSVGAAVFAFIVILLYGASLAD